MSSPSNSSWKKFPLLFSLYIAQSVPMSFFSTVVPVIMRQENYSLESIGLLQLVKLPWIAKFLWAPFVDNTTKSFKAIKHWIVFSELFYAAAIISVGFLNLQTDFNLIIILIILAFIASAFQDIGTDIFAIHILKKTERSLGNSIQSAGSFVGSLLGTGVLLLVYYYFGWSKLLFMLAAFVVFAIVPILLYKPRSQIDYSSKERARIKDVFLFFKGKERLKHLFLLIFYYSGIVGILAMLKPYLVDLGYNIKQIGFMSGIIGTSVAAIMAFLSAIIVKKIGRKGGFYLFSLINIAVAVYFIYISQTQASLFEIYLGICMVWGAYGLSTVVIYTSSMDMVRKGKEGTDFTVQIVVTHLSSIHIAVISGKIGDMAGYSGLFILELSLGLIALFVVYLNYPLKHKNDVKL